MEWIKSRSTIFENMHSFYKYNSKVEYNRKLLLETESTSSSLNKAVEIKIGRYFVILFSVIIKLAKVSDLGKLKTIR